jgi:hypothetical protein
MFPLHWILYCIWLLYGTLANFTEPYPELPETILWPAVLGLSLVWLGARIAPARKKETAMALFGLWALFVVGGVALTVFVGRIGEHQFELHGAGSASALALLGGIVAFLLVRKEEVRASLVGEDLHTDYDSPRKHRVRNGIGVFMKLVHFLAGMAALVGLNAGFIKILMFLYDQWGVLGVAAGLTFVPPILICPIWEWIATGHWMTFLFIYVLGLGGLGVCKLVEE